MHGFTTHPAAGSSRPSTSSLGGIGAGSEALSNGLQPADAATGQAVHAIVIGAGAAADQTAQLLTKLEGTVSVCPSFQSAMVGHANGVDRISSGGSGARVNALVVLAGPLSDFLRGGIIAEVRQSIPTAQLVAVATSATVSQAVAAMRDGVANVLLSEQPTEELVDGLGEALRTGAKNAQRAAQAHVLKDRLIALTAAENQVLDEMLAGMANKQIAQKLEIGLRTVELRRSKIMRKMQAKSLSELVKFICIARGIVDVEQA